MMLKLIATAATAAVSCAANYGVYETLRRRFDREASEEAPDPYEDVVARDIVDPDNIDVTFDSIGGYDHIKQTLYDLFILPLQRTELFSRGMLDCPQKGVLLYGPPGTGKTMLAKAIAKTSGSVFINVRASNLMSKHFGEPQKLVAALFTLAKKLQPTIIFIDEADGLLSRRRTTEDEALTIMKAEFLSQWDGFTTDQHARVMVFGATNRPSELDEAVMRRFSQSFEIGIPNRTERAEILRVILRDETVEDGIDYDHIAGLCDGCTGSYLLELCKKAAYFRIGDLLNDEETGEPSQAPRALSQSDLERVIAKTTKTSVAISEYSETSSQPSWSSRQRGSDDDQVQDAINELSRFDELQNLKKNNLSMREYLNKVKVLCDTLAAIGEKVSEADQVLLILGGLGSDHDDLMVSVNFQSSGFSLNELTSLLLSYESRLESAAQVNNEGSLPSANVAVQGQSNRSNQNTQSGRGRGRGRGSNQNYRGGRDGGRGSRGRGGNNRPACQVYVRNSGDGSSNFSQTINEGSLPSANVAVQDQSNRSNHNTQSGRGRGSNQNYRIGRGSTYMPSLS